MPLLHRPAAMGEAAGGVVTVHMVMGVVTMVTMPVTMTGLCRY
jgi:hypothetical protein